MATTRQRIRLRRDTAANWTAANPVLAVGEPGFETDTKRLKIGNGSSAWGSLPYIADGGTGGTSVGLFLVDASTPNVIYVGAADSGTAVSAAAWLITKSTFNATGVRTSKGQANNVTWTGRTGHTYT